MSGPALATRRPILKYSVIGLIQSCETRPCLIINNISITYQQLQQRRRLRQLQLSSSLAGCDRPDTMRDTAYYKELLLLLLHEASYWRHFAHWCHAHQSSMCSTSSCNTRYLDCSSWWWCDACSLSCWRHTMANCRILRLSGPSTCRTPYSVCPSVYLYMQYMVVNFERKAAEILHFKNVSYVT